MTSKEIQQIFDLVRQFKELGVFPRQPPKLYKLIHYIVNISADDLTRNIFKLSNAKLNDQIIKNGFKTVKKHYRLTDQMEKIAKVLLNC